MRLFTGVLVGLGFLLIGSPGWALTSQQAECDSALHGGICQVALGDMESNERRVVSVDLSAQCFPRIENYRLSRSQAASSSPPFGASVAISGVSAGDPDFHEDGIATVVFVVTAAGRTEHVYLGFIWQCEDMLP